MFRTFTHLVATLAFLATPAAAQSSRIAELGDALRLPDVLQIMREEGLGHGAEIADGLLPPGARSGWNRTLDAIYGEARMAELFHPRFQDELDGAEQDIDAMLDFFGSELGTRVVGLEISARRAMLDEEIEAAATLMLGEMMAVEDPRIDQLRRFVEANDLLEENVVGGLNSTYAFYLGLIETGTPGFEMSDADVLAEVWGQEPEIREDLEEWLYSYLALAYRPLEPEELDAYIAFSESRPGRLLNTALFRAFNEMFVVISGDLGRAAGNVLGGEDL